METYTGWCAAAVFAVAWLFAEREIVRLKAEVVQAMFGGKDE